MKEKKKNHFESNESYLHQKAKDVLKEWLIDDFLRIDLEDKFCSDGLLLFITDLSCYGENGLSDIYEVVFTNPVSYTKKLTMYDYFYEYGMRVNVWGISALWIMKQTEKPRIIHKYEILST